ncbi:hypothetical protein EV383_3886 [Pseudonocardia sediminis]|uniref:DUF3558 domain-containing protein n=1 Tax=Pseudonocardia sediminis TaxID=1397368 RepID=A0A4Q7V0Z1_PSEST|nr:hypothetical protein [Pseudonocardia sediminis]RZT86981.1 hypothetical protein EV383_3886 [Pseudonocardia sediminis]
MNARTRRPVRLTTLLVAGPLLVGVLAGCAGTDSASPNQPGGAIDTAGAPAQACALVPAEEIQAGTGIGVGDGTPGGDDARSTCTYAASGAGPGLTVGVETADRFADKAESTQRSSGVPAADIADVGEAARFYFSTTQLPTGLGTLVVRGDDMTVDVTVQGLTDPSRSRETATTVARTALDNG